MSTPQPGDRRSLLLGEFEGAGLSVINLENIWGDPSQIFSRTAVLMNIHQTDEHHTLEELRILPAIMQGVIVVSEDVPLLGHVPYARYFITSSYGKLAETVQAVVENYEETWSRLFGGQDFCDFRVDVARSIPAAFDVLVSDAPPVDPIF